MKKVVEKSLEKENINNSLCLKEAMNGDTQSYLLPNRRFSDHLFKVCMLSYINKSITYKSLDIKNKRRKLNQREKLILNTTSDEFAEEVINTIPDSNSESPYERYIYNNVINFQEIFINKKILRAINSLTYRQKEVLYMFYVIEKSDKDIAAELSVSTQAINKTRLTALRKIRRSIGG